LGAKLRNNYCLFTNLPLEIIQLATRSVMDEFKSVCKSLPPPLGDNLDSIVKCFTETESIDPEIPQYAYVCAVLESGCKLPIVKYFLETDFGNGYGYINPGGPSDWTETDCVTLAAKYCEFNVLEYLCESNFKGGTILNPLTFDYNFSTLDEATVTLIDSKKKVAYLLRRFHWTQLQIVHSEIIAKSCLNDLDRAATAICADKHAFRYNDVQYYIQSEPDRWTEKEITHAQRLAEWVLCNIVTNVKYIGAYNIEAYHTFSELEFLVKVNGGDELDIGRIFNKDTDLAEYFPCIPKSSYTTTTEGDFGIGDWINN